MLRSDIEFKDIIGMIKANPDIEISEIAEEYKITSRTVYYRLNSAGFCGLKPVLRAIIRGDL
jgi:transcriptional antiterminator